jgi:RNA polymerase sigma-70 factor (ECF subfamily)
LQIVRAKLLSGALPRIGTYAASGPIEAWVRMIVIRAAVDLLRQPRLANGDAALAEIATDIFPVDVTIDAAKQVPRLREAVTAALGVLAAEERMLLKLHYLDGVSLDRLAALLRVHRATVVRQIATVRRKIVIEVGNNLGTRFGTRPSELRSLWRTFGEQVQVTLSRLLTD